MTFPRLATKRWVSVAIRDEIRSIFEEYLRAEASARADAPKLRTDLDLLLVHGQRLEESVQRIENEIKELKLYLHKGVHDIRGVVHTLQGTVDELREILKPAKTSSAGAGEEYEEPD